MRFRLSVRSVEIRDPLEGQGFFSFLSSSNKSKTKDLKSNPGFFRKHVFFLLTS